MYRHVGFAVIVSLCVVLPELQGAEKRDAGPQKVAQIPSLRVMDRQLTEDRLTVRYLIQNLAEEDIWVCQDVDVLSLDAEIYLAVNGKTLMVRRRLDVPMLGFGNPALARYVRLRAGETREESLLLALPVRYRSVLGGVTAKTDAVVQAESLTIELGYFTGDLPKTVFALLDKTRNSQGAGTDTQLARVREDLGGLPMFYEQRESEYLRHRDTEFLMYYNFQSLPGERILRADVEGVRIPYDDRRDRAAASLPSPPLGACERMEIQVSPSALEFFLPDPSEQSLLNAAETERLHSLRSLRTDDKNRIDTFLEEIGQPQFGATFASGRKADVVCRAGTTPPTSFSLYDNMDVKTADRALMRYPKGLSSFALLAPETRPFALRQQCARHLSDLGNRFRSFALERGEYPPARQWCDVIVSWYQARGYVDDFIARPFRCPSGAEGKSSYGMNDECRAASAPDTVLLFETQGGWNQHGGPASFRFDHHDPRGGLVLLNGGTVKFIRTEEELKQLCWK